MDRQEMLEIALRQVDREAVRMRIAQLEHYKAVARAWQANPSFHIEPETDRERLLRFVNDPAIIKASKTEVI